MQQDLGRRLATVLREHQPPTHVDPRGFPRDEFDCCVEAVLTEIDIAMREQCTDRDCVRWRRHSAVSDRHLWKHAQIPPVARGIFGSTCFMCGQYGWRRIHKGAV
jgi:hypothetical protein